MVDAATKLLDDFKKLPGRVARPRTFMEIAGYPYLENVCSNILAFFMDPEESHGLGSLVLDALLSTGRSTETTEVLGGNISVEREVSTSKGRIDILITSENHAILIENKIHAVARNPFDDYAAYLDGIANGRSKRKILLTLDPTNAGIRWGFANLTHEELVGQIRSLLGRYVAEADARHLTMFLDFLNTLENLQRGSRMNQELVKLLADRSDDIGNLFSAMGSLRSDMRSKCEELDSLVNIERYPAIKQRLWRANTVNMFDNLQYDNIDVAEGLVAGIDARLSPSGWEIRIFPRVGDYPKLRATLQHLGIKFEKRGDWRAELVYSADLAYDEDLEQISSILQEVIDKLARYREA